MHQAKLPGAFDEYDGLVVRGTGTQEGELECGTLRRHAQPHSPLLQPNNRMVRWAQTFKHGLRQSCVPSWTIEERTLRHLTTRRPWWVAAEEACAVNLAGTAQESLPD